MDIERFWIKVNKDGTVPEHMPHLGQCWIWTAGKLKDGYGHYRFNGKPCRAHRVSYELANGEIPVGFFVLHKCDNPVCVNPDHLVLGTVADNAKDMTRKGRGRYSYGEKNGQSKLTHEKVAKIRKMYSLGEVSQKRISEIFGVAESRINEIVNYKSWKSSIEPPEGINDGSL